MIAGTEERGTFSLSIPNSASSSFVIVRRLSFCTSATRSIYGLSASCSNHSPTSSLRTLGANGRKLSRYFTLRLSCFCITGERGSAIILLPPKALGPNSMRPCIQPTAFSSASADATDSIISVSESFLYIAPQAVSSASTSASLNSGPK